MAKEMVDITDSMKEKGYTVVLVGLGSKKAAGKFADYMQFKGETTVDEKQTTYQLMGFSQFQPISDGMTAESEAKAILKSKGVEGTTFLIGGGISSYKQNGGVLVVKKGGEGIPFAYRSKASWDMPTGQDIISRI